MPKVIHKHRFLVVGNEAPKKSRFKGVVTKDSILGWMDYTNRLAAKDGQVTGDRIECRTDGFLGYTRKGNGTYTSLGFLNETNKNKFRKELSKALSKNGNILYDEVVSLENYQVAKEANLENIKDYANVVDKVLSVFLKEVKLDSNNILFWMDYHTDTKHPHIHFSFCEIDQTRSRGKFTEKQINRLHDLFAKEMGLRNSLYKETQMQSEEFLKQKDLDYGELINLIKSEKLDYNQEDKLKALYSKLPLNGRLQYGSSNLIPLRNELDSITKDILNSPGVNKIYLKYIDKVMELDNNMKAYTGGDRSSLFEKEEKRLYKEIGNIILQDYRNSKLLNIKDMNEEFISEDTTDLKEKSVEKINDRKYSSKEYYAFNMVMANELYGEKIEPKLAKYLAELYDQGKGCKPDKEKALKYYLIAAEENDAIAHYQVAKILDEYPFLLKNSVLIKNQMFQKAYLISEEETRKKEDPFILYRLSNWTNKGIGCKKDYSKAIEYCDRAIKGGFDENVGLHLKASIFKENKEIDKAKDLYLNLIQEYNDPNAMMKLGFIYLKERTNKELGLNFIKQASDLGNQFAKEWLEENGNKSKRSSSRSSINKQAGSYLKQRSKEIEDEIMKFLHMTK